MKTTPTSPDRWTKDNDVIEIFCTTSAANNKIFGFSEAP
jgi:hypothetical protein